MVSAMRRIQLPGSKPKKFKYESFMEAMPDIRREYIVDGMTSPELAKKYIPLVRNGFRADKLNDYAWKNKWNKARGTLAKDRATRVTQEHVNDPDYINPNNAPKRGVITQPRKGSAEQNAGDLIAMAVVDEQIKLEREGQRRHFARMEKMVNKVGEVLEEKSENLTAKGVGEHLNHLNSFDNLGRRLYNIDKTKQVDGHVFNIAVLTGMAERLV